MIGAAHTVVRRTRGYDRCLAVFAGLWAAGFGLLGTLPAFRLLALGIVLSPMVGGIALGVTRSLPGPNTFGRLGSVAFRTSLLFSSLFPVVFIAVAVVGYFSELVGLAHRSGAQWSLAIPFGAFAFCVSWAVSFPVALLGVAVFGALSWATGTLARLASRLWSRASRR